MLRATIAAAKAAGARHRAARATVYNYAPDAGPRIAEDAPQAPVTRKGAIRVEMEDAAAQASARGRAGADRPRRRLLRPGGAEQRPRLADDAPARPRSRRSMRRAAGDVGHAWAYLPDLAETMARLLDREADLGDFEVFHFARPLAGPRRRAGRVDPAGRPATRSCRSGRFPWFAGPRPSRRSTRRSARCWRCATSGADAGRPGQRQAGRLPRRRAAHRRSTRPCARPWRTWAAWPSRARAACPWQPAAGLEPTRALSMRPAPHWT